MQRSLGVTTHYLVALQYQFPIGMQDFPGFALIKQGSDADSPGLIAGLEFPAEFIGDRAAMVLVKNPDDLNHRGNYAVDFSPVGFTVFIFKLLIQYAEIDDMFQVGVLFPGKDDLVFQSAFGFKIILRACSYGRGNPTR